MKYLDRLVGPPATALAAAIFRPRATTSGDIHSILVVRPGGIGDAVLLIPAIKALRHAFPAARLDILAEQRNAEVFRSLPEITRLYQYDRCKELSAVVRARYDIVIDTEQWHRLSAVLARLARAPMLIGFATNARRRLFTHPVPYSQDTYELESFLDLLTPILAVQKNMPLAPFFPLSDDAKRMIAPRIKKLSGRKTVVIFPGGSIPERQWGAANFRDVAAWLVERGYGVVVVGGKTDTREGRQIAEGLDFVIDVTGCLTLGETAAVIQSASLLISGDSGILHIGYALGVKTIGLFGPGRQAKWAPRENGVVFNRNLPCSPCTTFGYTPQCANGAICMKSISSHEVAEMAVRMLNGITLTV
ncbi:MAG: glycosyltransferase family 9 protein [Nitrospiraceae bacterium]|nr:glycosyltransferase family 9 protein [Nitrospiraceae bacterium]